MRGQTKRDIHVKQDDLKTLSAMMILAASLEQNCVQKKDTNRVNYTSGGYKKGRNHNKSYGGKNQHNNAGVNYNVGNRSKNGVCYGCGKPGHVIAECRNQNQSQNKTQNQKPKGKCHKCGILGHIAKNCRVKTDKRVNLIDDENNNNDDDKYSSKFPDGNTKQEKLYGYARRREEHINMVQARTDNNKLMIIGGEINGVYLKRIVLDLGASISIMSRDVQKTHQFNLRKSNVRIIK